MDNSRSSVVLPEPELADHRHHLALMQIERHVAAADLAAEGFGQAFGDQERFGFVHGEIHGVRASA